MKKLDNRIRRHCKFDYSSNINFKNIDWLDTVVVLSVLWIFLRLYLNQHIINNRLLMKRNIIFYWKILVNICDNIGLIRVLNIMSKIFGKLMVRLDFEWLEGFHRFVLSSRLSRWSIGSITIEWSRNCQTSSIGCSNAHSMWSMFKMASITLRWKWCNINTNSIGIVAMFS